jgi:hypothetical protein
VTRLHDEFGAVVDPLRRRDFNRDRLVGGVATAGGGEGDEGGDGGN